MAAAGLLKLVVKLVAGLMALMLVSGAVLGGAVASGMVSVQQPSVQSVSTEWGQVTAEGTAIRTTVVVDNPNSFGVPGVFSVDYAATMNDVVVARGSKKGIELVPGRNTVTLTATVSSQAIAEWWVAHVEDGESSPMTVEATVKGPMGLSRTVPVADSTLETDILGALQSSEPRTVEVRGEPFVVLREQRAAWGEVTAEATPLSVSATLENRHDHPIELDGLGYEVRMNDVVVAENETTRATTIAPGETGTLSVTAELRTARIADWWASHVENGERTVMNVSTYGIVERDGERVEVPLHMLERRLRLSTDLLGAGTASVEELSGSAGAGEPIGQPVLRSVDRRWGDVTDATTEVEASIALDNPNEGAINDALRLEVGQSVTINEVVVAADDTAVDSLSSGRNVVTAVARLDNTKVPRWWARHVNRGERSTVVADPSVTADVGFTRFDVPVEGVESTVETDVLASLSSDRAQSIDVGGRTVAVVHWTEAEWGTASAEETPIFVRARVENQAAYPVDVEELGYAVAMNDVTVGSGTAPQSYTLAPGETRTLTFTLVIDSQRMDEWWVSHVENGEVTTVDYDANVTVASGGQERTVGLTALSGGSTMETNFLNATA